MTRRIGRRGGRRGQAFVEFAVVLPVVLLLVLFGIDFGRVFFGWVTLTNAARVGANYAAINPNAWTATGTPQQRDDYQLRMRAETSDINCALPATLPLPTFTNRTGTSSPRELGDHAQVELSCAFRFVTPFVGSMLGDPLTIRARAVFPVRHGPPQSFHGVGSRA